MLKLPPLLKFIKNVYPYLPNRVIADVLREVYGVSVSKTYVKDLGTKMLWRKDPFYISAQMRKRAAATNAARWGAKPN
ncbi:MAG: hypothetical protein J6M53_05285 [Bacteroidaceae bacterium]|nr:hypothetical protein [Bacteroidaceae bacterium]